MLLVRKLTRDLLKISSSDDAAADKTYGKFSGVEDMGNYIEKDNELKKTPIEQDAPQHDLHPTYYGIHLSKRLASNPNSGTDESYVFTDKKEVMKFMKEFPHARFKVFQKRDEAEAFARQGVKTSANEKEPCKEMRGENDSTLVTGEKTSSFKAPKPQELIQLRKVIERGDVSKFHETVWKNPRFMVGSGDTPTILQEGSRYNALHVASKAGNGAMVEAILETISNPAFVNLLYDGTVGPQERGPGNGVLPVMSPSNGAFNGKKDQAVIDCMVYLQDLYLNTPEKGLNETPLHFACKFGKVEAVKVLMSYPACDRMRLNKFGETAKDIICSRAGKGSEVEKEIQQILKDCFYVPVIRPGDSSLQACVGNPFSPEKLPSPVMALKKDPRSPEKEINAFAGPMSLDKAQEFCQKLKSPMRGKGWENEYIGLHTPKRKVTSPGSPLFFGSPLRLCDPERGLEREGRALAKEFHVGWKEYWPFVGVYTNLGSKEGMHLLENYLHRKLIDVLDSKKKPEDDNHKNTKRLDCIWTNDKTNTDLASQPISPISDLCMAMETCSLSSSKKFPNEVKNPPSLLNAAYEPKSSGELQPCHSPSPLHYVEKSCCVFARRISDLILRETCGDNKRDFSRVIGFEVHHLRRLVSSFKDDSRFSSINFSTMHSRVASLVAEAILESLPSSSINKVISALEVVQVKHFNLYSSSDEEDEKHLEKERNIPLGGGGMEWRASVRRGISRVECTDSVDEHTQCLMKCIKEAIEGGVPKKADVSCRKEETNMVELLWAEAKLCNCSWPTYSPHYHSKISSRSVAAVVRRLSFDRVPDNTDHGETINEDSSRVSKVEVLQSEPHQEGGAKDFFRRSRNLSGDSEHSSRDDGNSDTFYTPPSSPIPSDDDHCSSGDEEMLDSEEMPKVFIGGEYPTKEDLDVLNALENVGSINPNEFPHIYQWRTLVLMHTHEERESWPSPYSPRWIKQPRVPSIKSSEKVLLC
ncbi:ankyrin repeat and LEM domain-containing protein 2 homolog isoform X2 [Hetaerina americana]